MYRAGQGQELRCYQRDLCMCSSSLCGEVVERVAGDWEVDCMGSVEVWVVACGDCCDNVFADGVGVGG